MLMHSSDQHFGQQPFAPSFSSTMPQSRSTGLFRKRNEAIDWRRLASIDVSQVAAHMDVDVLQQILPSVAFCDITNEMDTRHVDTNVIKLFQLAQLLIEYLLYSQEYLNSSLTEAREEIGNLKKSIDKIEGDLRGKTSRLEQVRRECHRRRMLLLAQQQLMDAGPQSYHRCPHCPKAFVNQSFLTGHLERRHRDVAGRPDNSCQPVAGRVDTIDQVPTQQQLTTNNNRSAADTIAGASNQPNVRQPDDILVAVNARLAEVERLTMDRLNDQHKNELEQVRATLEGQLKAINANFESTQRELAELKVQKQPSQSVDDINATKVNDQSYQCVNDTLRFEALTADSHLLHRTASYCHLDHQPMHQQQHRCRSRSFDRSHHSPHSRQYPDYCYHEDQTCYWDESSQPIRRRSKRPKRCKSSRRLVATTSSTSSYSSTSNDDLAEFEVTEHCRERKHVVAQDDDRSRLTIIHPKGPSTMTRKPSLRRRHSGRRRFRSAAIQVGLGQRTSTRRPPLVKTDRQQSILRKATVHGPSPSHSRSCSPKVVGNKPHQGHAVSKVKAANATREEEVIIIRTDDENGLLSGSGSTLQKSIHLIPIEPKHQSPLANQSPSPPTTESIDLYSQAQNFVEVTQDSSPSPYRNRKSSDKRRNPPTLSSPFDLDSSVTMSTLASPINGQQSHQQSLPPYTQLMQQLKADPQTLGELRREVDQLLNEQLIDRGFNPTDDRLTTELFNDTLLVLDQDRKSLGRKYPQFFQLRRSLAQKIDRMARNALHKTSNINLTQPSTSDRHYRPYKPHHKPNRVIGLKSVSLPTVQLEGLPPTGPSATSSNRSINTNTNRHLKNAGVEHHKSLPSLSTDMIHNPVASDDADDDSIEEIPINEPIPTDKSTSVKSIVDNKNPVTRPSNPPQSTSLEEDGPTAVGNEAVSEDHNWDSSSTSIELEIGGKSPKPAKPPMSFANVGGPSKVIDRQQPMTFNRSRSLKQRQEEEDTDFDRDLDEAEKLIGSRPSRHIDLDTNDDLERQSNSNALVTVQPKSLLRDKQLGRIDGGKDDDERHGRDVDALSPIKLVQRSNPPQRVIKHVGDATNKTGLQSSSMDLNRHSGTLLCSSASMSATGGVVDQTSVWSQSSKCQSQLTSLSSTASRNNNDSDSDPYSPKLRR